MRIKYEVSAGGLVLRRNGASYDALLIGRGSPRVWSLPKGHVEPRETQEKAALREVREETGCWGEILTKLSDISYWFYLNGTKHKKAVHFYLMRYRSGDPANHDHEVDEAAWFEIGAAKKALKYVNEKRLIDLGLDYLASLRVDPFPREQPAAVEQRVAADGRGAVAEVLVRESHTR
jgi:8-oxo-dGTP pyrophosphatase MutT (NUDIX family)